MDTVSYLTINDETKEIADMASRDTIENIAAIVAANSDDIEYIQLETGPQGSLSASITETQAMAEAAQISAAAATNAAALADEKAVSASAAADIAWGQANSATTAANIAWDKAEDSSIAAEIANQNAKSAADAANAAWTKANSASDAADRAWDEADSASKAADKAWEKADEADKAAGEAKGSAKIANQAAVGALAGLGTLESVIDTVNWFAEHRTLTDDTEVDPDKNYYIFDETTGAMSQVNPDGIENPHEKGWYELDETIQNYVASHVAETDDGLYVLSTASGWRVLVSTGGGKYVAGVFIVDPQGVIKQGLTGAGIQFDNTSPFSIGDDNAYIMFDGKGHITLGGTGVNIASGVTIGGDNRTLTQMLNDLDSAITAIEYGIGSSNTSHSDVETWSTESPAWEPGRYVWMRTSNGTTYTYTCIQGAQGPQGETGEKGESGAPGTEGVGVASVVISYGISDSEHIMPEEGAWRDSISEAIAVITPPSEEGDEEAEAGEGEVDNPTASSESLPQGSWLWVRTVTTYTDDTSSATYQKSYIGTDGLDGSSVFIQGVSKKDGVTTVTLIDDKGNTETLTINDGQDGENGLPGKDGMTTHFAWAMSADGKQGFSTSNNKDKIYMGVYKDAELADSDNPEDYSWSRIKGSDGKDGWVLNIHPGVYTLQELPPINNVEEGDAYLVNNGDNQYDLYYKGRGATNWTVIENWQGIPGEPGKKGDAGPEAVVTITPSDIDWDDGEDGSAVLTAVLRVNGTIVTPKTYKWTEGTSNDSLGTESTLTVTSLKTTYNCTVTW